jgi:hypothetical protein
MTCASLSIQLRNGQVTQQNVKLAREFIAGEVGKWLDCWKEAPRRFGFCFAVE